MKELDIKIGEIEAQVKKLEKSLGQLTALRDELTVLRRAKEILNGHENPREPVAPLGKRRDVDVAVAVIVSAGEWLEYNDIVRRMEAQGHKPYKPTLSASLSKVAKKESSVKEHSKRRKVFAPISLKED